MTAFRDASRVGAMYHKLSSERNSGKPVAGKHYSADPAVSWYWQSETSDTLVHILRIQVGIKVRPGILPLQSFSPSWSFWAQR